MDRETHTTPTARVRPFCPFAQNGVKTYNKGYLTQPLGSVLRSCSLLFSSGEGGGLKFSFNLRQVLFKRLDRPAQSVTLPGQVFAQLLRGTVLFYLLVRHRSALPYVVCFRV